MKIKLALLENDSAYLRRIVPMFNSRYAEELEIYSFTDAEAAFASLEEKRIDVLLANSNFKIDFNLIPRRCGFAYLVESLDINSIEGHKAVCKFQKGELIYKQVLSIYSEHMPNITGISQSANGSMKTIVFCSPCGGVGTSTTAAGCAIALTNAGYRVLYVNAEVYGEADHFFSCDGQFDFSEIIYAVKSNKTNRTMKLQSTVKQDATGVYYYSSVKIPLDMMDMKSSDYITLKDELQKLGCYDYVIMDMDFPRRADDFRFFEHCNSVVVVTDGSENSNSKISKALNSIQIMDSNSEFALQPRMWLLRNKTTSNELVQNEIRILGTFPMYQSVSSDQMARQLSLSDIYKQLI